MIYQARPWQDNEEQPDVPTPDEMEPPDDWIDNQLHQYVEEHLSAPEPYDPGDADTLYDEHYWEDDEPDDTGFFEPEEEG